MLKVEIIGNIGADAEIKRLDNFQFVTFNVAHTSRTTDKSSGQFIDTTYWVSCKITWDCSGLLPYLKKGVKVYVRGFLTPRVFTGHDGQQHAGLNCNVSEIELCGGRIEDKPF